MDRTALLHRNKGRARYHALWTYVAAAVAIAVAYYGPLYGLGTSLPSRIDAFEAWFRAHGGLATHVRLAPFEGMGLGLQATATIHANDQVLFVPSDIIIGRDVALNALPKAMRKKVTALSSDNDVLATFLVYEKLKGPKSKWAPYLAVLPTEIALPMEAPDAALLELQDPGLVQTIRARQAALRASFATLESTLARFFAPFGTLPTLELHTWAHAVLSSRALTISGRRLLVPFADMFNGKPHEVARAARGGAHFLDFHRLEKDGMYILADRAVGPLDQLFEDYGDSPNHIYFVHHGFLMDANPFDCVHVLLPLSALPPSLQAPFRRLLYSDEIVDDMLQACFTPTATTTSAVASAYLQLVVLSENEATRCVTQLASCANVHVDVPTLLGRDTKYAEWLLAHIHKQVAASPTQLQDDLALLSDGSAPYPHFVAYRARQKQLLLRLQAHLTQLPPVAHVPAPKKSLQIPIATTAVAARLARFHEWVTSFDVPSLKIRVQYSGPLLGFGAFATDDIGLDEIYVAIPPLMLMDVASAMRCTVLGPVFRSLYSSTGSRDPMHELLLHVMHERYVLGDASAWFPYLDLLPALNEVPATPLFYTEAELALLEGTDLGGLVLAYRDQVTKSYDAIRRVFPRDVFSLAAYTHTRFLLDTRSIWWGGERHLVPILDMVNCLGEGPVHSTVLESGVSAVAPTEAFASTRAKTAFAAGAQVFENYGQPNWIYLLYHGFVLEKNPSDCLHVILNFASLTTVDANVQKRMASRLQTLGVASPAAEFCLQLTDEIPKSLLTVAAMYTTSSVARGVSLEAQWQALHDVLSQKRSVLAAKLQVPEADYGRRGNGRRNEATIRRYLESQLHLLDRRLDELTMKLSEPLMVVEQRSWLRLSIFPDMFWGLLSIIQLFFSTFFGGAPDTKYSSSRRGGGGGGGGPGGPRRPIGRLQPSTCVPAGGG
ncbi:hypothetical protein SDRG_16608 [Saprolegnia diclina VS20]|uniref:SET domain-containing protein n=1 Tax=Saprolegnia diclina (strain VS20) TaxID=1156394 RepID=T0PWY5_SAPDV|nr:hypothetical protein SDRG_16608 [Saprolegnia diclina VS20]EQC25525.1 hypothetical protein SDRG_16608 [Saprolegnia diclina VS20]|eukprot:XP_008621046.1 hypothetical protein SDRG_16608 [Saprolegnia diclina VS20]